MVFRAAFYLLPLALLPRVSFAQTAPPEVEKALRARVTEFFQYHVDGDFEKAYDLVAADTRKYYFGAEKLQFKSFKIDSISYSDNFTKAIVTLTGERMLRMRVDFPESLITVPMSTNWKIENGKWVWFREVTDTWLTPMGPSDPNAIKGKPGEVPKTHVTQEMIDGRAKAILGQSNGLSKEELKLTGNKASSDEVVFHNGQPGQIRITLVPGNLPAGLTAKLEKTDLSAGEDAVLKVHYEPQANAPKPPDTMLQLWMEPFNRRFTIPIKFEDAIE